MGIQVNWDDERHSAISITYIKPWNWEDFDVAYVQMLTLLDSINHPTDIIFDIRDGGYPPRGAIQRFKRVATTQHPNTRHLIFVSGQTVVTYFLNLIIQLYGRAFTPPRFMFADSLENARQTLAFTEDEMKAKPAKYPTE